MKRINAKEYEKLNKLQVNENNERNSILELPNFHIDKEVAEVLKSAKELDYFFYNRCGVTQINPETGFRIPRSMKDHSNWIKFDEDKYHSFAFVQGLVSFPYMSLDSEYFLQDLNRVGENWEVWIINPKLLRYSGAIGLFFTPKLYEGGIYSRKEGNIHVMDINSYFEIRTGYSLFYKFSIRDIEPIEAEEKFDNSINGYYNEMMEWEAIREEVKPALTFWYDNYPLVENSVMDRDYNNFNKIGQLTSITMDLHKTSSSKLFQLYIDDQLVLDDLKWIEFDVNAFDRIDYDKGTYNVSEEEKEKLLSGDYELKFKTPVIAE